MTHVKLSGLRKSFGSTIAVESLDLDVAQGEFLALLGPSGCGKTTAMRMIAGITAPDSGEVHVGDKRIDLLPPENRNIGLVFQSYALFPHMTVANNVGFGLRMRGVSVGDRKRRIDQALRLVDLAALGGRYPRELSGGQQQRVALARAIVIEPSVLLLDEPLSNLDAKLREQLREDLRALQRRLGTTTIYVTHDQSEAMAMADRVVLMNAGRVIEIGNPRDLYRAPRHRFTAEFLGHTNLVPATAFKGLFKTAWGAVVGRANGHASTATFSVRPEDIVITSDPMGQAQVTDVTFLGSEVEHKIHISGIDLRVRSSGTTAPVLPIGAAVTVTLPKDAHMLSEPSVS